MERNGGFLVLRRTRAWHEVDGVFSMRRVSYVGREGHRHVTKRFPAPSSDGEKEIGAAYHRRGGFCSVMNGFKR